MSTKNRFKDPDLHTPAHDAIMLWLEENAREIMFRHFEMDKLIDEARQKVEAFRKSNSLTEEKSPDFDAAMSSSIDSLDVLVKWEVPVSFHGGQRYIDMLIEGTLALPLSGMDPVEKNIEVEPVNRWDSGKRKVIEYEIYLGRYLNKFKIACEVKSTIRSVGELIRQLRQYESPDVLVAVVSPDDRFRDVIESQGFIFIKAPKPDVGPQGALI